VADTIDSGGSGVIAEMIRQRAFEISQSDRAGTPEENWALAEAEVRGELEQEALDQAIGPED
jgi:hypothetical protein